MRLTFENLAVHNKRSSIALVAAMILFLTLLGAAIVAALSGYLGAQMDLRVLSVGAIGGAGLAIVGSIFSYFGGGWMITAVSGAQPLKPEEDPQLFNIVEEMAIASGLPMPKIYLIDDVAPNAFATGRDPKHAIIGVTTGLRQILDRDEMQAVIAHEMSHIHNYDIRLMMLVGVYAGIIVFMADYFMRIIFYSRPNRSSSSSSRKGSGGGPAIIVIVVLAFLLAAIAPFVAKFLQLAVSREREYLADATAVKLCRNPLALASALEKLSLDTHIPDFSNRATEHLFIVNPMPKARAKGVERDSIWATHPPLSKRISRLQALAATYL